jgi:hypothetical protein
VSERLRKHVRKIFAQYGGAGPSYNTQGPGGVNFGRPGGFGNTQVNQYYETPLDEVIQRVNDPSLYDSTDNLEKRHEIYHTRTEENIKGYNLDSRELSDLKKSDNKLRYVKVVSNPPADVVEAEDKDVHKTLEQLLDYSRRNSDEKHPYEDSVPDTIKPTRRHAQVYTNRGTGTTVFKPQTENDRHPADVLRYNMLPDGQARKFLGLQGDNKGSTGKGVDNYLQNPKDYNFMNLYGDNGMAFDYPQDQENPKKTGYNSNNIIKQLIADYANSSGEQALRMKKELEDMLRLPAGPGKERRLNDFLGDGIRNRDETVPEIMGVADKYPSPEGQLFGVIPHSGY